MPHHRHTLPRRATCLALAALPLLPACALLPGSDPVRVSVAGIEALPGQGLELRFLLSLRVVNPNDRPIDYDGVFVEIDLQGRSFAVGASDIRGSVPRFSEQVLQVPLTVSALGALRQMLGLATAGPWPDKLTYQLRGKIGGVAFSGLRFQSQGQISLAAAQR